MIKLRGVTLLALVAGTLGGCSSSGEAPDRLEQGILRATAQGGRDQVVMLYVTVLDGSTGAVSRRTCSGSYFAPRVVATAAHCLDGDPALHQQVVQVLVYYGNDFNADQSELEPFGIAFKVPAPGQ